jgi:hypothetical protein
MQKHGIKTGPWEVGSSIEPEKLPKSRGLEVPKPDFLLFAATGHLIDHNRAFNRPDQAI